MIEIHPAYNGYDENIINNSEKLKGGFLLQNSRKVIIGTFPPYNEYSKNRDFFFYPSPRNHFWNRIDNIFRNDINYIPLKKTSIQNKNETIESNYNRKRHFCLEKKLSFIDSFSKIERKDKNSTKDKDIIPKEGIIENNFLLNYITMNNSSEIYLLFTYKTSFNYIKTKLTEKKFEISMKEDQRSANKQRYCFRYKNKIVNMILLYPATRSRDRGELKDEQYKYYLFDI